LADGTRGADALAMRIPILLVLCVRVAHADPTYELATNPLAIVDEEYSVSMAAAVASHVVVRGELQLAAANVPLADVSAAAGLSVRLFLDHAFQGPFIEPGVITRTTTTSGNCLENSTIVDGMCGYTPRTLGPEIYVGWQWTFGSHFTGAASFGVEKVWFADNGLSAAAIPHVFAGALRVGYAW
jgi:hypothetical protein